MTVTCRPTQDRYQGDLVIPTGKVDDVTGPPSPSSACRAPSLRPAVERVLSSRLAPFPGFSRLQDSCPTPPSRPGHVEIGTGNGCNTGLVGASEDGPAG